MLVKNARIEVVCRRGFMGCESSKDMVRQSAMHSAVAASSGLTAATK